MKFTRVDCAVFAIFAVIDTSIAQSARFAGVDAEFGPVPYKEEPATDNQQKLNERAEDFFVDYDGEDKPLSPTPEQDDGQQSSETEQESSGIEQELTRIDQLQTSLEHALLTGLTCRSGLGFGGESTALCHSHLRQCYMRVDSTQKMLDSSLQQQQQLKMTLIGLRLRLEALYLQARGEVSKTAAISPCLHGWQRLAGSSCYQLRKLAGSWYSAVTGCARAAAGARLASLDKADVRSGVAELMRREGVSEAWVGAVKTKSNGWSWLNGADASDSHQLFEASSSFSRNCALMQTAAGAEVPADVGLHGVTCQQRTPAYICQI